jgi:NAD(P)-dependent dehydrogenase (short-subunit alcohol dehydrogenase family)
VPDLSGLVALVTGGNGGIGLGMVTALAQAGADIAIWGTNPAKNDAATKTLAATVAALGKVDSVIANAGVTGSGTPFVDMELSEWRSVLDVNLDGVFLTLREAARHLVARNEGGALVAVSSTSAIHGAPRNEHYSASKAAVLALVRSLAVELARHRIRCNTLLPGWTETDLTAAGRRNPKFVENTTYRTPVRRWAQPADDRRTAPTLSPDPMGRRIVHGRGDDLTTNLGTFCSLDCGRVSHATRSVYRPAGGSHRCAEDAGGSSCRHQWPAPIRENSDPGGAPTSARRHVPES